MAAAFGAWLANKMAEQLRVRQIDDPVDAKLDVRLRTLKPTLCEMVADALAHMDNNLHHGKRPRAWDISGTGKAMDIVDAYGFDRQHPDFLKALELNKVGKLFEKFTGKSKAKAAEDAAAVVFKDIMEDEPEEFEECEGCTVICDDDSLFLRFVLEVQESQRACVLQQFRDDGGGPSSR